MKITFEQIKGFTDFPRIACWPWTDSSLRNIVERYDGDVLAMMDGFLPEEFKLRLTLRPSMLGVHFSHVVLKIIQPVYPIWVEDCDSYEKQIRDDVQKLFEFIFAGGVPTDEMIAKMKIVAYAARKAVDRCGSEYYNSCCAVEAIYHGALAIRYFHFAETLEGVAHAAKNAYLASCRACSTADDVSDELLRQIKIVRQYIK